MCRLAVKNLVGGRTYYFRVLANSLKSYESSEEVKYPVPARVKHKAITAGVVGGILFFIVAIILSVCAVKICNKRKRRKQEKGTCWCSLKSRFSEVAWKWISESGRTGLVIRPFPYSIHTAYPLPSGDGGLCLELSVTLVWRFWVHEVISV